MTTTGIEMSNPTELPDLDKLEALARGLSDIRDQIMQDRVVSVVDVEDLIDRLALARRAQPEGEAPNLPLKLVDITSHGHAGWANLIYTGEDCPGLPVAMLAPFFVPLFRRILAGTGKPEVEAPQAVAVTRAIAFGEAARYVDDLQAEGEILTFNVIADGIRSLAGATPAAQHAESGAPAVEVIEMLLGVAYRAFNVLDGAEETDGGHVVDNADYAALSEAMDRLDELPDDQPGYTMEAAAKARWALRPILVAQSQGARKVPEPSRRSRIECALRQIIDADDGQTLTQDLIDSGRAALAAKDGAPAVQQAAAPGSLALLNAEEMAALHRFQETCQDFDSGGYDVDKNMMKRLAAIGVIESKGFNRYQFTEFGDYVVENRAPKRPRHTGSAADRRRARRAGRAPTPDASRGLDAGARRSIRRR